MVKTKYLCCFNLQLKLWDLVGWQSETQVEQLAHAEVQAEPGGVVVGVEAVAKVSPARVESGNTLELGSET